ncbi:MAG: hypoxanthine phosphoribosyltransferase [Candidatus Dormibacteria bacterium]
MKPIPTGRRTRGLKSQEVDFAHPSEREFARMLDFYRIKWEYEPTSFPLSWNGDDVTEMFTPDFYLPEEGTFIELTTMKQSLVTAKNRKLRGLRELYPDVRVTLLYQRDYRNLLARYGYGAVEIEHLPEEHIQKILFSAREIRNRVQQMGRDISRDYAGTGLVLVGVLKGITFFLADLARRITVPVAIDYLGITAYSEGGPERVRIVNDLQLDIRGKHVLLVEDVVNTGFTLDYILSDLHRREPASLEVCALLDKRALRLVDVPLRYAGFEIDPLYVVGYGLDYQERYRNLPFICVLKKSAMNDPVPGIVTPEQAPAAEG